MEKILQVLKKLNKNIKDFFIEQKPYTDEHACRLEDPSKFDRFTRVNNAAKHKGKRLDFIYGFKADKSKIQAIRYKKNIWTASSAKVHCTLKGGSFEAAKKEE